MDVLQVTVNINGIQGRTETRMQIGVSLCQAYRKTACFVSYWEDLSCGGGLVRPSGNAEKSKAESGLLDLQSPVFLLRLGCFREGN